jgi:hypothetical protein
MWMRDVLAGGDAMTDDPEAQRGHSKTLEKETSPT